MNAALAASVVLAGLVAISGCTTRAPTPPEGGASTSPPPLRVPRASSPAPVLPSVPVAARLVAASAAGESPASGGSASSGASSQCLAQIEAFAESHSGNRVMLGQAAFADSNQLVLTRMPRRSADGTPLDGRAAVPQPLVIELLAGPEGCLARVAESGGSTDGGVGAGPGAGSAPSSSAHLPACSCLPLAR